jgi:hypothetical protein
MTLTAFITEAWTISRQRNSSYGIAVKGEQEGPLVVYPNGIIEVFGQKYHCSSLEMAIQLVGGMGIREWLFNGWQWLQFD